VAIALGDSGLARISMCLRSIHRNLQKCIPGDRDIVSRRTLLNRSMNVPDLPGGMMKSLEGKDDPIVSFATCDLSLLHKHDVCCGMTLMAWIQSTCKSSRYGISVVIRQAAQC